MHEEAHTDRPKDPPISEIMTGDVVCVSPEISAETLMALLLDKGISGAPVIDSEGKPIGSVSKTDLMRDAYYQGATDQARTLENRKSET